MAVQRAQITAVFQTIQQDIRSAASQDPALISKLRTGESEQARALVQKACDSVGLSVEEYQAALRQDPALAQLEQAAWQEALNGSADPGPYGAISRESPNAREADRHKPRHD